MLPKLLPMWVGCGRSYGLLQVLLRLKDDGDLARRLKARHPHAMSELHDRYRRLADSHICRVVHIGADAEGLVRGAHPARRSVGGRPSMTCEHVKNASQRYARSHLDGEEKDEADAHLGRGCAVCRKSLNHALSLNALVLTSVDEVAPSRRLK